MLPRQEAPDDYAKVFKQGNSQEVRLPKAFRFAVDEVYILSLIHI